MKSGVTGLAYETIEVNRRLPLLEPMSEIAGECRFWSAVISWPNIVAAAVCCSGGSRRVAGQVVVLGGGTSGINAARMGQGMGADVTILEVDLERMRFLDITLHTAHTLYSNEAHLMELLALSRFADRGGAGARRARAQVDSPKHAPRMRPGSVLVDIAIDQGGCAETSRPTTHHEPVFVEEGVTHYCVANMPGAYARTATQALTNVTYRYIELLADSGLAEACQRQADDSQRDQHDERETDS